MRIIANLRWLIDLIAHRRMIAFWAVAAIALPAPWLVPGCASRMVTESKNAYENCQVLNVHDGDTMTVSCQGDKIKVRLYCIDAPELGQEPWGKNAREHLKAATPQYVNLHVVSTDRYGRLVSEVYVGDRNLNMLQVRAGRAVVYGSYCTDPRYFDAEQDAKRDSIGVWNSQGLHQAPWKYRH